VSETSGHVFQSMRVRLSNIMPVESRYRLRTLRLLLILIVWAILVGAQSRSNGFLRAQASQRSASSQSEAQAKIRVNSNLVILPVTVKDRNGNLVPELQKQEFRVFDDNVEQSIDVFTAEAFPLSLVVLIDDDLKSNDAEQLVQSLRAVVAGISSSDEAAICRFDLKFYPGEGFTDDPDRLLAELKKAQELSGPSTAGPVPFVTGPSSHAPGVGEPRQTAGTNLGSRPTKALDDAVYSAAELLHDRDRGRRKIMLVISDGINGREFNSHTYQETLAALLNENISVYSVAVGSTSFHRKFTRLFDYANNSGGDISYASRSQTMEKLYSQITEQARHEYTLAYVPRGNNRTSTYHAVEVRTTREGLHVKTRQGYYAPRQ
jgi:Ca-activated chloride channel homolog